MFKFILILAFTNYFVYPSSFGNKEIYYITENSQCDNDENYKIKCEIIYSKTSTNKYIKVTIEILNTDSKSNLDGILEYDLNLFDENIPLTFSKSFISIITNDTRYYFIIENIDNEKNPLLSKEDTNTNIPEINQILKEKNIKSILVEEYFELKNIPQKL